MEQGRDTRVLFLPVDSPHPAQPEELLEAQTYRGLVSIYHLAARGQGMSSLHQEQSPMLRGPGEKHAPPTAVLHLQQLQAAGMNWVQDPQLGTGGVWQDPCEKLAKALVRARAQEEHQSQMALRRHQTYDVTGSESGTQKGERKCPQSATGSGPLTLPDKEYPPLIAPLPGVPEARHGASGCLTGVPAKRSPARTTLNSVHLNSHPPGC